MIYKVVFKQEKETKVIVEEIKVRGVKRILTDKRGGISFIGSKNEVLAFVPSESLLYAEKVEFVQVGDYRYPSARIH